MSFHYGIMNRLVETHEKKIYKKKQKIFIKNQAEYQIGFSGIISIFFLGVGMHSSVQIFLIEHKFFSSMQGHD